MTDAIQTKQRAWIQGLLDKLKINATTLAKRSGVSPSTVSRFMYQDVKHALSIRTVAKISEAVGETPPMESDEFASNLPAINQFATNIRPYVQSMVHIHGTIRAGQPAFIGDEPLEPKECIAIPSGEGERFPGIAKFALRVVGDSMNLKAPDGSIVVCVKLIDVGRDPVPGETVVVLNRTRYGFMDATLKDYTRRPDGVVELWPRSTNPDHQKPLTPADYAEGEAPIIHAIAVQVINNL